MAANQDKQVSVYIDELTEYYKNNRYMDVIAIYEKLLGEVGILDFYLSNLIDSIRLYHMVYVAYITTGDYESALQISLESESLYKTSKVIFRKLLKEYKDDSKEDEKRELTDLINIFQDWYVEINKYDRFAMDCNIAYAYYKNKNYKEALRYYCKLYNLCKRNNLKQDFVVQIILLKSQTLYYYNKQKLAKREKDEICEHIEYIKQLDQTFDTVMCLGKLYYFVGRFHLALNYIEYALDVAKQVPNKDRFIFAYDWLSRIAYKQKRYDAAAAFYEKLIEFLVTQQNKYNCKITEVIHPYPRLADMTKYLHETKEKIAKQDVFYVNKSIRAALVIATLYGSINLYELLLKLNNSHPLRITIISVIFVILVSLFYTKNK